MGISLVTGFLQIVCVGGYATIFVDSSVDADGTIAFCAVRFSLFATMMTGNILTATQAAVKGAWQLSVDRSLMVVFYLCGVLTYHAVDQLLGKRTSASAMAPIVAFFCALPDLFLAARGSGGEREPMHHAYFLAVAMGVVNAVTVDDGFCTFAVNTFLINRRSNTRFEQRFDWTFERTIDRTGNGRDAKGFERPFRPRLRS